VKFGPVAIDDAVGAILAHATDAGDKRLRKARVLTAEDVAELKQARVEQVIAAVLDADDLAEDEAAARVARALIVDGVVIKPAATGRVNIHAVAAGVFAVDRAIIDAINKVDPAITIATVAAFAAIEAGQMVATVKIIPFAVKAALVEAVAAIAAQRQAFAVKSFRPVKVGIVQTVLPGVKDSVLAKTVKITEARLARSGSTVTAERRTAHDENEVADALGALARDNDMVVMFGASAVSDPYDVLPAAIRRAGGEVIRTGMPVDPGNLIVVGRYRDKPVLGAPGCARSPKENGFDWVLDRLIAGIDVTDVDIAGLGVGGLLMEIPTRPQPREAAPKPRALRVDAIVLAAGRSSRMGGPNKLLALFDGRPLIARTVETARASRAGDVVVVTGHQEERVAAALAGAAVKRVHNPDYASGLAGSLKAGVRALALEADGALIVLGDMPGVTAADLDRLIAAFAKAGGAAIVRATHNGKRGNPVILPKSLFPEVQKLEGDTGARHIVESEGNAVVDVEIGTGASVDVDTPEALQLAGGVLRD
jgi:molybdenum cofactor cytidylyltransferase